jgi:tetratricopeptide (TPR) repeat protein
MTAVRLAGARTNEQPEQQEDPAGSTADPASAADAEGWALLESLRRRLDEQANQHRKTQSDVRQLAESIGALVTQQRKRSWWMNVNSFVAYLMFTLLCGGASYFMYQSRAHELVSERDRVISERDEAVQRADTEITKTNAREDADKKALEVYQLLQAGKRDEAAKKLAELAKAPLSKLDRTMLDERAKQAEVLQVESALKTAQAAFKAGRYPDVIPTLEAALTLESQGPRAAQMHYYIGVSYAKGAQLEQAATHLEAALAQDVDFEDARFHLASVLDRAGQWGKAKIEYDRFATAHPMSPHAAFAMRRGGALRLFPAVRPANAPAEKTPAAQPVPAQPAPPGVPAAVQKAPAPQPKTIDFNDPSTE